jgi:hypothetical protein
LRARGRCERQEAHPAGRYVCPFDRAQDGGLAGAGIADEEAQEVAASKQLFGGMPLATGQLPWQAVGRANRTERQSLISGWSSSAAPNPSPSRATLWRSKTWRIAASTTRIA